MKLARRLVAKGTDPRAVVLERMKELTLRPVDLEKKLDLDVVPKSSLHHWLNGKQEISDKKLAAIFVALGLVVDTDPSKN